jgi:hypothetical protein
MRDIRQRNLLFGALLKRAMKLRMARPTEHDQIRFSFVTEARISPVMDVQSFAVTSTEGTLPFGALLRLIRDLFPMGCCEVFRVIHHHVSPFDRFIVSFGILWAGFPGRFWSGNERIRVLRSVTQRYAGLCRSTPIFIEKLRKTA